MPIHVNRTAILFKPDAARVLLRPFSPGNSHRVAAIITRILALPEETVTAMFGAVMAEFSQRHWNLRDLFLERFEQVKGFLSLDPNLSQERKLLIGSYFMAEYSLESAALFNPSIVAHPDQKDVPEGALRFVVSLRATGEGHVSSVTFREGIILPTLAIEMLPTNGYLTEPHQIPNPVYEKTLFRNKLGELGLVSEFTEVVLSKLGDHFVLEDLRSALKAEQFRLPEAMSSNDQTDSQRIWLLARSNYEVQFKAEQNLSQRVLFPATPAQRNGIEDARFTCFQQDDGSYIYYATFTAFDGSTVMPELLETVDFLRFRFLTLNGSGAKNKGMAIFPRKINGRYAMLSRQDNESIYLMFSDNVHFWSEHQLLLAPAFPWELIQIGNCGSPIETEAGWLVLSHGVGPMRKYCIGAFLLDLHDPSKVIGRLREPLLQPNQDEREGYVPNVVYTCGAILYQGELIIPYGLSDHRTGFATVTVNKVLAEMTS